jgi:hypothetical protein
MHGLTLLSVLPGPRKPPWPTSTKTTAAWGHFTETKFFFTAATVLLKVYGILIYI